MTDTVLYEVRDRTALITLNRPDRLNAWNVAMAEGYFKSLDRAAADPAVYVIVVTGAGRGFCAGADMGALQDMAGRGDRAASGDRAAGRATPGAEARRSLPGNDYALSVPKPVIAAVNGACAGLGLVHALACDLRFAAGGAKFTVAFSRRGLIGEHGISWTLPRLVGQAIAFDLMVSGRVFLAEEAKELGVVNQVFPAETLLDETLAYAEDLATNVSPTSMAVMKEQIYSHPMMPLADAMAASNRLMAESLRRPDFTEGVASFVEKRTPSFAPYTP
jgi:enoyl-CoA hydratase/carnithine racemase